MMYARMVAATGDTNLDYDSFVAALTTFGSGQMSSLNAAMRRAGLPGVPGNLNSVMAYAARQIATGNALRGADAASAAGQSAEGEMEEAASLKSELKAEKNTFEYMKSFEEQVDDYQSEDGRKLLGDNSLLVGEAPSVFTEIGLPRLPVTIDQKHTGYALKGNYPNPKYRAGHKFSPEEFKKLPEKIAHPIAIGYDPQSTKQVIVYVDMVNTTGKQVIVPLRIGGITDIGGHRIQALKLLSNFAHENGANMLESVIKKDSEEKNTIFYLDKEKATEAGFGVGMITTNRFPSSGLIHSITDPGSQVKLEIQNQTQTLQFEKWFSESQVVNEDKTPKVMYHGTASDFWAFDMKKSNDKTGRRLGLGAGANKIPLKSQLGKTEKRIRHIT